MSARARRYECHLCGAIVRSKNGFLLGHLARGLLSSCAGGGREVRGEPIDDQCAFCTKLIVIKVDGTFRDHRPKGKPGWDPCDGAGLTPERAREVAAELAAKRSGSTQ